MEPTIARQRPALDADGSRARLAEVKGALQARVPFAVQLGPATWRARGTNKALIAMRPVPLPNMVARGDAVADAANEEPVRPGGSGAPFKGNESLRDLLEVEDGEGRDQPAVRAQDRVGDVLEILRGAGGRGMGDGGEFSARCRAGGCG